MIECPADVKVVVRVYADVETMSAACVKAGLVAQPSLVLDFVKGFMRGQPLFDFVACAREAATEKLAGK